MKVEKQDGRIQEFRFDKIERVINILFKSVDEEVPDKFLEQVKTYFDNLIERSSEDKVIQVEDIQNAIRDMLIKKNKIKAAQTFILVRNRKDMIREQKSWLSKEIAKKLNGTNIENQNANLDEASFGGRMGEATRVVTKDYALKRIVSKMARDNHNGNMIYIHDLDNYAVGCHNCLSIPFDDLLAKGFKVRTTDVRPANSVNTACQLVAVIFQIQSLQQFGGVSATHIDWTMVPYIRKSFMKHYLIEWIKDQPDFLTIDIIRLAHKELSKYINHMITEFFVENPDIDENDFRLDNESKFEEKYFKRALLETTRETYQAVEGMYHNLNTLQSRSGNQLPFTSLNYGTCTLPEGQLFTKALLEVSIEGLGEHGRTSIFPCGIFQYMKGVNDKPGTPNYYLKRLAIESTSKRLYPNYANVDWSGNAGYDRNDPRTYFSTMGCRTANGFDINGLGQMKDGRGNICPVTIIMPTLAMMAREKEGDAVANFMAILDKKIHEAKDMLLERFYYIAKQSPKSAKFMYENNTMAGYVPEEGIISALKHGTLAIGQLGLAETLQILIGTDHVTPEGMALAKQIEQLYKDRCAEFKKEYHLNFGVYFTPAENLCFTAFKKWKEKYGEMENVTYYTKLDEEGNEVRCEKLYFTNSMHIPVWHKIPSFQKIELESQLTGYSSAGCITYVEMTHEIEHNPEFVEKNVDFAMEHDIPYFAINRRVDMCKDCGHIGYIDDECPICGSHNIEHLARVTGYLTGDFEEAFNPGKIVEKKQREEHWVKVNLG